ncbi:MAG TPA: hypothetical protein QGH10_04265 [Armatimonadota bacterium]|nr:hypothetical protein [Armatimonadota bacterium]
MGFIALERFDHADIPAVQAVLDACAEHLATATAAAAGRPSGPTAAARLFRNTPRSAKPSSKRILGICRPQTCELLGIIDAIVGYPALDAITVGLFALVPSAARPEVEGPVLRLLEEWAAANGARTIRVVVHDASVGRLRLWLDAAYEAAEAPMRAGGQLVVVVEKDLAHPDGPPAERDVYRRLAGRVGG